MINIYLFNRIHDLNKALGLQFVPQYKRLLLPVVLLVLLVVAPTREITVNTLSDAFWAVSTYVAFTLVIYHYLSRLINKDNKLIHLFRYSRNYQVFFSALMGSLPGCGGAIIVTTQFVSGRVGFGAMVSVLTSTMGDAAFLLLASEPKVGFSVILMGIVIGTLTGWVVNLMHSDSFLRPKDSGIEPPDDIAKQQKVLEKPLINLQGLFWKVLILPGIVIAILGSFQLDINQLLHLPEQSIEWIGSILIIICMFLWALTKEINDYQSVVSEDEKVIASHPIQKAAQDTNFVTAWVIVAFLTFELTTASIGVDFPSLFSGWGTWMPLAGLLVGLLPGCGPQIIVTSLFISGAIPFSTQLANAISNDGDALFPAIALAPKAALVASVYSAVPALLAGYAFYWLFEV